ncbi:hypothetical protein [Mucilaginibacter lappiensis]|uniref:hypothetical protein n=1 Tax=Mucilaginibacter lappiensis TaxID=354630 RepID=UPI003D2281C1
MQISKPEDFILLLEVFRRGLILGLNDKRDVVSWADNIIINTEEPDYFFIELSLCNNLNNIVELLGQHLPENYNPICERVLMALLYKKLIDDDDAMTVEAAAKFLSKIETFNILTTFESNNIYAFDDYEIYYLPDLTQLQVDLIHFLAVYEAFDLKNYEEWPQINTGVEKTLKEEAQAHIINEGFRAAWQKKGKKRRLTRKLRLILTVLIVLGITLLVCMSLATTSSTSYFSLYFLGFYFMVRWAYKLWIERKR